MKIERGTNRMIGQFFMTTHACIVAAFFNEFNCVASE